MIEAEVIPKKWGNSIAVIIDKDTAEKANIRLRKRMKIFIPEKRVDLSKAFGTLKFKKTSRELKNLVRKELHQL